MPCSANPTTINLKDKKSTAAIFLGEGMRGRPVSTRSVLHTIFPAGPAAEKIRQIPTHLAIQIDPFLHPGNGNSLPVFVGIVQLYNTLNLLYLLHKPKNRIKQGPLGFSSILYQCHLFLIDVIKNIRFFLEILHFFLDIKHSIKYYRYVVI
jgi:hypothetical protein